MEDIYRGFTDAGGASESKIFKFTIFLQKTDPFVIYDKNTKFFNNNSTGLVKRYLFEMTVWTFKSLHNGSKNPFPLFIILSTHQTSRNFHCWRGIISFFHYFKCLRWNLMKLEIRGANSPRFLDEVTLLKFQSIFFLF